jgi:LysM repeat protein
VAFPVRVVWGRTKGALAAAVLIGALGIAGQRTWQGMNDGGLTTAVAAGTRAAAPVTVPVTIRPGDSLWALARRYGDPNAYMLDRVDRLARANGVTADAVLVPGQKIVVPVFNPAEVAKLRREVATVADPAEGLLSQQ